VQPPAPLHHRDVLDALFAQIAPFARKQRQKYTALMPVGMTLGPADQGHVVAAAGDDTTEILEMLRLGMGRQLRQQECEAAALVYDASVSDGNGGQVDALIFDIEHRDGESVRLYIAYRKSFLGRLKFEGPGRLPTDSHVISRHLGDDA
jgi:hypothetical protein